MRRALAALATALALLPATGAAASVYIPPVPHDSGEGCAAIKKLVANLNAGRLREGLFSFRPGFYSDALGQVDRDEEQAFLHALRHSEGKPDRQPIRLHGVFAVREDEYAPVYLVVLEREAWHETRLEGNPWDLVEINDPHYSLDSSYWLASFDSNHISRFREAHELYGLADEARRLAGCAE